MRTISMLVLAAAVLSGSACSFEVTNPGPIANESVDDPGAWEGLVRGVAYNTARGIGIDVFYSAVAAKEFGTAGRVHPTKLPLVFGQITTDDMSGNAWNWTHAARWQAEDGARRVQRVLGSAAATNSFNGQLLMYAALNNRILGENFCEAVLDGGPKEPNTVHLVRAESLATEAIAAASAAGDDNTLAAARVVRASVRLYREDFPGAAADAQLVPTDFRLEAQFDGATRNLIVETNDAAIGGQFRAHTVWRTFFEDYYRRTGDPRVAWDSSLTQRFGEFGDIVWYRQQKYSAATGGYGSPIRLAGGEEARLIEAEVLLRAGDIPGAMLLINGLRTNLVSRGGTDVASGDLLPAYPDPANANEAWMNLFHERRIELWLEARSMGDLRRWVADGTYGDPNGITPEPDSEDIANRIRLCFPIPRGERQTNPNLTLDLDDPVSPIYDGTIAPW
jgi:hypothetical protein